jgi:cytidylate kinase
MDNQGTFKFPENSMKERAQRKWERIKKKKKSLSFKNTLNANKKKREKWDRSS